MAYYCSNCGKVVQDGETCTCSFTQQQAPVPPPAQPQYTQPQQPQYGQPGYQQPAQPGQVQQAFGEFTNVLGGFAKDPVGAAGREKSVGVSLLFLGVEAIAFIVMFMGIFGKMGISSIINMGVYGRIFAYIAIEMALMFFLLFVMTKVTSIQISPQAVLSSVATASIPWSAAFLVNMLVILLFGEGNFGLFLFVAVFCFAIASSLCFLEIGLRSNMQGTGNIARLLSISVAFAVQAAICMMLIQSFAESAMGSMMYGLSRGYGSMFW